MAVTIYHNPNCGTSRSALALIRAAGVEPEIIEYLKTPLSRGELADLIARMGVPVREAMRAKEPLYAELELGNSSLTDNELLDAMAKNPVLLNRPIVSTPLGARLCRPAELALELLPQAKRA